MKKIITAINNPRLNEELKKEEFIEIIGKDIQYREAIIEIIEKNKDIDIIIINDNLPGEIENTKIIKQIKEINEKIKIIYILEKENIEKEKILKKENITDIYYNNKINLEDLINIIKEKEINEEEEIKKELKYLKEIILNNQYEKNIINNKRKNKKIHNEIIKLIKKIKEKIINKIKNIKNKIIKKRNKNNEKNLKKIITISGIAGAGKSTIAINLANNLAKEKNKILLIDLDIFKQDIYSILGIKKYSKIINKIIKEKNKNNNKKINNKKYKNKNKLKKIIEKNKTKNNLMENKINKNRIKKIINLLTIKINKKINLISGINLIIKNKKNINEEKIKKYIKIFLEILKEKYDYIIVDMSNRNSEILNKEILQKADTNIILLEANLLGIKGTKAIINKYIRKWKIEKRSLHIITNKSNKNSIDKKIIEYCFPEITIIGNLKYKELYNKLMNTNYKNIIEKNILKKEYKKIVNKIK